MSENGEVITGSDFKRMIVGAYSEFILEYDKINAMNTMEGKTFYSGQPGSDILRTMGAAVIPLGDNVNESIGGISRRVANAAVLGARGNAGVILASILQGLAKGLTGKYNATSTEFGKAFQYGILYAQRAVPDQPDRPIIRAAKFVAKSAYVTVRSELPIHDRLMAAISAGMFSLAGGIMDPGEKIMLVFLQGCLKGLDGSFVSPVLSMSNNTYKVEAGVPDPRKDLVRPYCVNFMVENTRLPMDIIEKEMQEVGNFVVVERRQNCIFVHLHTANPGQMLERAVGWGRLSEIHINSMAENHAMITIQAPQMPLALLTVANGMEEGMKLQDAGATVIVDGSADSGPSVEDIVNAVHSDIAEKYILLTDSEHLRLVMNQARQILGDRVRVVLALDHEEQLLAVRAFFPELSLEENCRQMRKALENA